MEGIHISVEDLCGGEILAQDLYVENRKLMGSGSCVTDRLINVLKRRNVKTVEVMQSLETKNVLDNPKELPSTIKKAPPAAVKSVLLYTMRKESISYLEVLAELNIEQRYGKALQNIDDTHYITNLFDEFIKNETYRTQLELLKEYDHYTFIHAVDVFTLCTLFAKREGLLQVEKLALGFLFHDIGKLQTPISILKKRGKLTREEMRTMQKHTIDGESKLCQMGLQQIAYLAKSHHEQSNGNGYPDGILSEKLPREVQILQLVDVYSAITLTRPYKEQVSVPEAMEVIYKDKELYDEELLNKFMDFIGIYPVNAVVLLSDGSHAIIEKVNEWSLLLPTVRQFQTATSFQMPYDFTLKIHKILSYNAETPGQLFSKFSDYLMNNDDDLIKKYYAKLKDHYRSYEWYTHIHIPLFQIFSVLKRNNVIQEVRLQEVAAKFTRLLMQTTIQLRLLNKRKEMVLLVVDENMKVPVASQLFEGLLHSEEIHSVIASNKMSEKEMDNLIDCCNIEKVYVLGNHEEKDINFTKKVQLHHLTELQLETLFYKMNCVDLQQVNLQSRLEAYKVKVIPSVN